MKLSFTKLLQKVKFWDGTNTAGVTASSNVQTSIEELATSVSSNSNSQLNVTQFTAAGTEGQILQGTKYVSGISGVDASTEVLEVINYEHHEIHSGSHFNICDYMSFSNGQVVDFTVITPNTTKWTHMTFHIEGGGAISANIYETAVVNAAGTSVASFNNNRNSSTVTGMTIRVGDTFTSTGNKINGGHAGANKSAGIVARTSEIVLKQNTTYLFRITNETSLANVITWCAEWYEHTDKN